MSDRDWDPNDWQAYCLELLTVHYGVQVQPIPDRDRGDGGLEAYVASESTAFQCYAPEDPYSVDSQTTSQISKIRTDTNKLLTNAQQTCRLIGPGRLIEEWVLLTPAYESKRIIEYANRRSAEILASPAAPPWLGDKFRISIHDETLFPAARDTLTGARRHRLSVESDIADLEILREQSKIPQGIEEVLTNKFIIDPQLKANNRRLSAYLDENLKDYFRGAQELERLSRDVPSAHRQVTRCAEVIFSGLARELAMAEGRPTVVVGAIEEKLRNILAQEVPGFGIDLLNLLARYYIASWWVQCPLEFDAA